MYTRSGTNQFCHPTFSAYRKLCHDLLVFHEFLFKEEHNTFLFDDVDKKIRQFMGFMKNVVNRQEGNGFRFPKFHQILHALNNIRRHGSMRNFDSGPSECQGKTNAKQPARLTQKRAHSITLQSGHRIIEGLALDSRLRDMRNVGAMINSGMDKCNTSFGGNKYIIKFKKRGDGGYDYHIQWFGTTMVNGPGCCPTLVSFLCNHVVQPVSSKYITCYTEYRRYGIIFRAHPSYRSSQEWYDWAYIKLYDEENDKNSICPAKIYCFVKDECETSRNRNLMVIIKYAENMEKEVPDDNAFPIVERRILSDTYFLVDADCIDEPCYAVPDISGGEKEEEEEEEEEKETFIIVKSMDMWGDEFMNLDFEYY